MSAPPHWTPVRLKGERWLAVRLSIAPLRLPAFTVTWFDVRAVGPVPVWVLFLGAMGLHVYGEGSELVVQDRWGSGKDRDQTRLAMLVRWIEEDAVRGSSALQGLLALDEGGSATGGALELVRRLSPQKSSSGFVEEVRARLLAGHWDLPAGKRLEDVLMLGPVLPTVAAEADRSRQRAPGMAPVDPDRARSGLGWAALCVALASMGLAVLLGLADVTKSFERLRGTIVAVLFMGGVFLLLPTAINLGELYAARRRQRRQRRAIEQHQSTSLARSAAALEQSSANTASTTYRTSPEQYDPTNFVKLHDAMRLEGSARLDRPGSPEVYEAWMAEVLLRYRRLTDPPASPEAP